MTERYLPVPIWNSAIGGWEPIDSRGGQRMVSWPNGFNPLVLPIPEYINGDHVQFVRDETCAREGIIRRVSLRGGVYGPLENQDEVIRRWYLNADEITYIVTARGHDHRIKGWNILGRFVSLERLSRIIPLQE
ncbi:MAG TPA: hypothetical protein VKR06_41235 [Ktedonosporobacter sp.]|nr:hypothetical protein [Ktedonosporobacter sp.]